MLYSGRMNVVKKKMNGKARILMGLHYGNREEGDSDTDLTSFGNFTNQIISSNVFQPLNQFNSNNLQTIAHS